MLTRDLRFGDVSAQEAPLSAISKVVSASALYFSSRPLTLIWVAIMIAASISPSVWGVRVPYGAQRVIVQQTLGLSVWPRLRCATRQLIALVFCPPPRIAG